MNTGDYQPTLADYLAIIRRRAVLIACTFVGVLTVGTSVAVLIPPVYEASGTIMIESQQIPTELVQATVTSYADERIEVIKQRVMTRENLLRIINKFHLFADRHTSLMPSEQIDEVRKDTQIELITANVKANQKGTGTIAFKVSFSHRRPEIAQGVANELVTLFLDENVKVRTERATQTTEFLKQESQRMRAELDKLETQIAAYKQEHGGALQENLALALSTQQRIEADLRQNERDLHATEEEIRYLEGERSAALSATSSNSPAGPTGSELDRARAELAKLQATYTDSHPDVRALKRRIENLEKGSSVERGAAAGAAAASSAKDPAVARIDARIGAARSRFSVLSSQQVAIRARLVRAEAQLANAPQVERGLAALTRDYQAAQRKYEEIRAKLGTAQVAENLEGEQKAERFVLLEPPTIPDKPIKPDRKRLVTLAIASAIGAAAGMVVVMESIHGTIRGLDAVSAVLGHRPLVTVPYITIAAEDGRRRRMYLQGIVAAVVGIALIVTGIHFLYMPLEILVPKILLRMS